MGTREQKSIETTNKIILAAKTILASRGYPKTTISAVAESAGVSRGLLHYHFKSKEDMLAKVLSNSVQEISESLDELFANCATAEECIDALVFSIRSLIEQDSALLTILIEGSAASKDSQLIRDALYNEYKSFHAMLRQHFSKLLPETPLSGGKSIDSLVTVIIGIADGIGLQFSVMPELARDENNWAGIRYSMLALIEAYK